MAFIFNNASNPKGIPLETGPELVWHLKQILVEAGWVVTQSGTGTAYSPSGDLHGLIETFTGGTNAWFAIQAPDGRAFTFQRVAANVRVKYAATGGFTGGTPGNTITPSAIPGEEQLVAGSGTDAAPTGVGMGTGTAFAYIGADDEAPYGFFAFSKRVSSTSGHGFFFMDPLIPGSYAETDTDPVVIGWSAQSANWPGVVPTSGTSAGARGWMKKASGGAFQGLGSMNATGWGTSSPIFPAGAGSDPESGGDITIPVIWGRAISLSAPHGWKGVSSLFRAISTSRSSGETQANASRILIQNGEWSAPWNGEVPLI